MKTKRRRKNSNVITAGSYSVLQVVFILQRNTGYFLIQVGIYSTLKQKLCVLSVWLDLKSGISLNKGSVKKNTIGDGGSTAL